MGWDYWLEDFIIDEELFIGKGFEWMKEVEEN